MAWNEPPIKGKNTVDIKPYQGSIEKKLSVPGSKSLTNRSFLLAAVAEGTSKLTNFLKADDSHWCLDVLKRLGVAYDLIDDSLTIVGTNAKWSKEDADLYIGDAGTLARFLPGLLAASQNGHYKVDASAQLAGRPILPVLTSLQGLGCQITPEPTTTYPYVIDGSHCRGGKTHITGTVSSQFVSGLLLAAPLALEPVELIVDGNLVQKDYVEMTLRMMADFGVVVDAAEDYQHFTTQPQRYKACDYAVEADASTASYFFAMAAATKGKMTVQNLKRDCLQPDIGFLEVLEKMGCTITETASGIELTAPEKLRGNQTFDMEAVSDTTPTLAAIAPFADGPITITGVKHIRNHECDRLSVLYETLTAAGVPVEETEGGLIIQPAKPQFVKISSYDDHRIAMSMAVMGLAGSGIEIDSPGCVAKTCPIFFELLEEMGLYKC